MGKEGLTKAFLTGLGIAVLTGKKAVDGAVRAGEFLSDHREEIQQAARLAGTSVTQAAKGFGQAVYDTACIKIFSKEKIEGLRQKIEFQGREYRTLTELKASRNRTVDSLAVGGDVLRDVLKNGASSDVKAAYAAAYPQESLHTSFEDAVRNASDEQLPSLISAVKGKLFEQQYATYLNDGQLPDGYSAELAHSATQPGWDIAIRGADGHVASVLQMKATDSVSYVKQALERYPDIDVVTTDEVYSQLIMNGAADHVMSSGMDNADITQTVVDSVDSTTIHMHWTPPIISMALIAFTAYTLQDADVYQKVRHFGERSGKSYLAYLIGGGVACITQTWWLGLVAGIGSRYLAASGARQRDAYNELDKLIATNNQIINRLRTVRLG